MAQGNEAYAIYDATIRDYVAKYQDTYKVLVDMGGAKESATVFTNDRGKLVSAISERAGEMQTAIAHVIMPTSVADKAAGAGIG